MRLLVRPEALHLAAGGSAGLSATVIDRRFAGASTFYLVTTGLGTGIEVSGAPDAAVVGQTVTLVPVSDPADRDALVRVFAEEGA